MLESLRSWVNELKLKELDKNNLGEEKYSIATKYKTFTKEQRKAAGALRKLQTSYFTDVCSPQALFETDSVHLTVGNLKRVIKRWGLIEKQFTELLKKQQRLLEMANQVLEVVAKEDSTRIIIPDTDEKGMENLALLEKLKSTVSGKKEKDFLARKRNELQKEFNEVGIHFDSNHFDLAKLGKDIKAKFEEQVAEMQAVNMAKVNKKVQESMLWLEQQEVVGTTLEKQVSKIASGGNGSVPKKIKEEVPER
jgi:hypothetical protein